MAPERTVEAGLEDLLARIDNLLRGGDLEGAEEAQLRLCRGSVEMMLQARRRAALDSPAPARSEAERPRILHVEDDRIERDRVASSLGGLYDLTSAASGEEALGAVAGGGRFDLVIADLMLPGMSGMDLVAKLKSLPAFRAVPMIALTFLDDPGREAEGFGGGLLQYVRKPCPPEVLALRVAALLGHGREALGKARRELRAALDQALEGEAGGAAGKGGTGRNRARARELGLSDREIEVAFQVLEGLQNKEVAARLNISVHTVVNHMRSIYAKTGAGNRVELMRALR